MAISHLDLAADGFAFFRFRNTHEIHVPAQNCSAGRFGITQHDFIPVSAYLFYIHRMTECHPQTLALAYSIMHDAFVPAQNISGFIDIIPFPRHGSVFMVPDKIRIITIGNKAYFLRIGF